MSKITTIPLADQIIAVLRTLKLKSYSFVTSEDIALQLDRTRSEIVLCLHGLHEEGNVTRLSDASGSRYKIAPDAERTRGCCCCCNEKLFPASDLFCHDCGPHFAGRV